MAVCEQNNLRCMSHLHMPEPLGGVWPGGAPGAEQKDPMEDNLHTFVRDVGHVVKPGNRDSKFLALGKIALVHHHLQEEASKAASTPEL